MLRKKWLLIAAIGIIVSACKPTPPLPTLILSPAPPTATLPPSPTRIPLRLPTPTATPIPTTAALMTPDPKAIQITDSTSRLEDQDIILTLHLISKLGNLSKAIAVYQVEGATQSQQKTASLPSQKAGQPQTIEVSLPLDVLPPLKSTITFHWQVIDSNDNTARSADNKFKLTEATTTDQRDDLPLIDSKTSFVSNFPNGASVTLKVTPKTPILYAHIYITTNHGIQVKDAEVSVPNQTAGQPLTLTYTWSAFVQIPWQSFETWWVLIDENNTYWRTEHAFNDYADTKFHTWTRTPTKYAVLYTYGQPADVINTLKTATDQSIIRLQGEFNYKLIYAPHIVVYSTHEDFANFVPPDLIDLVENTAGLASGDWGGAVVMMFLDAKITGYTIIQHELTHVFQFQSIRDNTALPRWWIEGSARYFEDFSLDDITGDYEKTTRQIIKQTGVPSLLNYVSVTSPDNQIDGSWDYYVGRSFVAFLHQKYGKTAFALTYLELARNVDLWTALQAATGKSPDALNAEWGQWVSQ